MHSLQYLTTNLTFKILHSYLSQNAPVKQRTDSQPQHLQNQKKHSKVMHNKQPLTYQR